MPQPLVSNFEATEFDRLVSQVLQEHTLQHIKTWGERRAERLAASENKTKEKEDEKKSEKKTKEKEDEKNERKGQKGGK